MLGVIIIRNIFRLILFGAGGYSIKFFDVNSQSQNQICQVSVKIGHQWLPINKYKNKKQVSCVVVKCVVPNQLWKQCSGWVVCDFDKKCIDICFYFCILFCEIAHKIFKFFWDICVRVFFPRKTQMLAYKIIHVFSHGITQTHKKKIAIFFSFLIPFYLLCVHKTQANWTQHYQEHNTTQTIKITHTHTHTHTKNRIGSLILFFFFFFFSHNKKKTTNQKNMTKILGTHTVL